MQDGFSRAVLTAVALKRGSGAQRGEQLNGETVLFCVHFVVAKEEEGQCEEVVVEQALRGHPSACV